MPNTGVCLGCLGSPRAKGYPTAGKSSRPRSQVRDQQLHGQITRHCYIHARNLKWTSLEHRRRQIRLVMLCKINKGLVDISPASFLRHSDPRTRGTQRLHQEQTQHPVLSRAFFSRTVSEWSRFPASISTASSLESFQNRLGRSPHNVQPVPISR